MGGWGKHTDEYWAYYFSLNGLIWIQSSTLWYLNNIQSGDVEERPLQGLISEEKSTRYFVVSFFLAFMWCHTLHSQKVYYTINHRI